MPPAKDVVVMDIASVSTLTDPADGTDPSGHRRSAGDAPGVEQPVTSFTVAAPRPAGLIGAVATVLERARFAVLIGSVTALALAVASFAWAVVKAVMFVGTLVVPNGNDDLPLVKLFESVDTILIGTVLLMIGLGLWELFIHDLDLPPALTVNSFDDLKYKIASTLLLVLVVRFLEALVSRPAAVELLEIGAAVTLVGGLLLVYANWHGPRHDDRPHGS